MRQPVATAPKELSARRVWRRSLSSDTSARAPLQKPWTLFTYTRTHTLTCTNYIYIYVSYTPIHRIYIYTICVYLHVHIHVHIHVHTYLSLSLYIYIYIYTHVTGSMAIAYVLRPRRKPEKATRRRRRRRRGRRCTRWRSSFASLMPVSLNKTPLLHQPCPCNLAAEAALQSLIGFSESLNFQGYSSPEHFCHRHL